MDKFFKGRKSVKLTKESPNASISNKAIQKTGKMPIFYLPQENSWTNCK